MSHYLLFLLTNTVTIYLTLSQLLIRCAPYPSGKHHASVASLFQKLTPTYHWLFLTSYPVRFFGLWFFGLELCVCNEIWISNSAIQSKISCSQHICDLVSSTWNNPNYNYITGRNCVSPPLLGKENKYFKALTLCVCSCVYLRVKGRRSCLRICA